MQISKQEKKIIHRREVNYKLQPPFLMYEFALGEHQ